MSRLEAKIDVLAINVIANSSRTAFILRSISCAKKQLLTNTVPTHAHQFKLQIRTNRQAKALTGSLGVWDVFSSMVVKGETKGIKSRWLSGNILSLSLA
jgi:hypothetical protein